MVNNLQQIVLPDEAKDAILEKLKGDAHVCILTGHPMKVASNGGSYEVYTFDTFSCSCEEGKGKIQDVDHSTNTRFRDDICRCKYCGGQTHSYDILFPDIVDEYKEVRRWERIKKATTYRINDFIYVKGIPGKIGVEIFVGDVIGKLNLTKEKKFIDYSKDFSLNYYIRYIPGEEISAKKVLKRSQKDVGLFEAFNINSQNIAHRNIIYEGSRTLLEFMFKNMDFFKRCGFMNVIKNLNRGYNDNALFVLHLSLLAEYPALELLIKMGYTKMYSDVIQHVAQSGNKDAIAEFVNNKLSKIINSTTKGSLALAIPTYVGEYLREKSADIDEFITWADIFSFENISKEEFLKIIDSEAYFDCILSDSLSAYPNILKYGYKFNKVLRYIHKQVLNSSHQYRIYQTTVEMMAHYLDMCDVLEIAHTEYPQDLETVHKNVSIAFNAKSNEINDSTFEKVGSSTAKYLEEHPFTGVDKLNIENEYTVVIPRKTADFLDEAQQQQNCVGRYCHHVVERECVLFFIRKKDDPKKSFITAECSLIKRGSTYVGRLGQFYLKNNRPVRDNNLYRYAASICTLIGKGVSTENIVFK